MRFGSGSETNFFLDVEFDDAVPRFTRRPGSIALLCRAAHLCDQLENLDFFIRCVNIQDKAVTAANKDVNKFLASANNITKHIQAGLTSLDAFLFARINAGNVVSLALNQGWGWAGDENLRLLFDQLFTDAKGSGFPAHRAEPQAASRDNLQVVSEATHRDMPGILEHLPDPLTKAILSVVLQLFELSARIQGARSKLPGLGV